MSGPAACACGSTAGPFTAKTDTNGRPICEDCETPEEK
jgi:hypothetical protein